MCLQRFATSLILVILFIPGKESSLLSRFKNPKQIVASKGDLFLPYVDLDDDTYSELVAEVPHVREYWRHMRDRDKEEPAAMPYLKQWPWRSVSPAPAVPHYGESEEAEEEAGELLSDAGEGEELNSLTPTSLPFLPLVNDTRFTSLLPNASKRWESLEDYLNDTLRDVKEGHENYRRFYTFDYYWRINYDKTKFEGPRMATCYACNHYAMRTPVSTLCYDAFQSDDWKYKTRSRYLVGKCYDNRKVNYFVWAERKEAAYMWIRNYREHDKGLVTQYYGFYTGGCFKRWTDVGKVYTYRGCRQWAPMRGSYTYVSHRFRKLEFLLHRERDACVHSPHASLTPFNRGISLFVRYHVCVCPGKLCNHSTRKTPHSLLLMLMLLYVLFI